MTPEDIENYTPNQIEKLTPEELEASFATCVAWKHTPLAGRFFEFDSVNESPFVKQYHAIVRDAANIVSSGASLVLSNVTGRYNKFYNTPAEVNKAVTLKVGLPTKKTIFSGYGERILGTGAEMTLYLRDKLLKILSVPVGSDDTPVTYGGASLLTDGGLETWTDANTLTNWTDGVGAGVNITQTVTKHSGTWGCKILGEAVNMNYIEQGSIAIIASRCYQFEFWHIQDSGETNQHLEYYILDDNAKYLQADLTWGAGAYSFSVTCAQTWTKECKAFVTDPAAASLTVRISNRVATTDDCIVDDLALHDGNPACIIWNLLTEKAGLSGTFSSSNTDIDHTAWDTLHSLCCTANLWLEASLTGQSVMETLQLLQDYASCYIFPKEDDTISFKRLVAGGTSQMAIDASEYEIEEPETLKDAMVNSIEAFYGLSAGAWAGSETDSNAPSITDEGTYSKTVQDSSIWHYNSASAVSYVAKVMELYSNPIKQVTLSCPLAVANLNLGDLVTLSLPLYNLDSQYCRVVKITNRALVDGRIELLLKDLSCENFLFSVNSMDEWNEGTIPAALKLGDGYISLGRTGAYAQFDSDEINYVNTGPLWLPISDMEVTNAGEDDLRVLVGVISGGEVLIRIYDEDEVELDSYTFTATGSKTMDVEDCPAGKKYTLKRWVRNGTHSYTRLQRKPYAASGTYTSSHKYWEGASVGYNECKIKSTLGVESATLQIEVSDDNFANTTDTWGAPQALAGGIETFDISALASAKYVRFKVVLNSAGGIVSPTVDYCQIFPS